MTANQVQIKCKIRWCSTSVLPRIYRVLPRNHRVLPWNYRVLPSIFSSVDSVTEFLPGTRLPFSQHWCSTYRLSFMLRNLLELTYLQKDTYCSSSCPGGYSYYTCKFDMLRRKLQPMCRMQFRLFSLSQHRRRVDQSLPQRLLGRYLNEYLSLHLPVRPVQQEEEAAATVIDSCNPLTFLYDSQCINISLSCRLLEKQSRIFLISEYGREGQCLKNLCLLATGKALRAKFSSTMTLREARLVC